MRIVNMLLFLCLLVPIGTFAKEQPIAIVGEKRVFLKDLQPSKKDKKRARQALSDKEYKLWRERTVLEALSKEVADSLLKAYAKKNNIVVQDQEIQAFNKAIERSRKRTLVRLKRDMESLKKQAQSKRFSKREQVLLSAQAKKVEKAYKGHIAADKRVRDRVAKMTPTERKAFWHKGIDDLIALWKVNRKLYNKYGGKVLLYGRHGPEPIDAVSRFLKEEEKKGRYKFLDRSWKKKFLGQYSVKQELVLRPVEAKDAFKKPYWEL